MTLLEESEFISCIPQQRACIDALLHTGIMQSYSVSRDCSKVWGVVRGESEGEVRMILDEFSLGRFVEIEIVELAVNNITISQLLTISMN